MRASTTLLAITVTLLAACRQPASGGVFSDTAYYPARDHYRVRAHPERSASPHHLLSAHWQVDNFQVDPSGRITDAKRGPDWRASFRLDEDGDGRPDRAPATADLYDLRFIHDEDGSVIWSRTIPVDATASNRRLDVVAHDLVDRVGGSTYFRVDLSSVGEERRIGTRLVEEGPVELNGASGWLVTFDVIALDQEEANAEYVGDRVTLVMVRPHLRWMRDGTSAETGGWSMLTMFGLAGRAEIQPQHRGDFEQLLSRVDVR
ncbi:MAG: hypothetical protein AB7S26_35720 [Sandaracinaceae bacterium]